MGFFLHILYEDHPGSDRYILLFQYLFAGDDMLYFRFGDGGQPRLCGGCIIHFRRESYNYFNKLGNIYAADFGLNYMVGERVQLDLAANLDLCHPAQAWAVSFGVAWQINNPKSK